jgi:hypothetical protein
MSGFFVHFIAKPPHEKHNIILNVNIQQTENVKQTEKTSREWLAGALAVSLAQTVLSSYNVVDLLRVPGMRGAFLRGEPWK